MALSTLAPGFRFNPTDDVLVMYYLKRKLLRKYIMGDAIAEVNIYDFDPWELPDKSSLGSRDLEWYFFCPKSKKYTIGSRENRATKNKTGFWKVTGNGKKVLYKEKTVGIKKTLVFHRGNVTKGERTDWVMHEYRITDEHVANAGIVQGIQDTYVVCRIFEKSGAGPKNGAQYGAPFNEEEWEDADVGPDAVTNPLDTKQKGPATMTMGQSTRSLTINEPGSSSLTFSANETVVNSLDYKQKGPAISNVPVPVPQSTRSSVSLTEAGSSMVTISANETMKPLDYKQKGVVATNAVPHGGVSLTEPGSSTFACNASEMHVNTPANDYGMMYLEDFDLFMVEPTEDLNGNDKNEGVEVVNEKKRKRVAPNEEENIFGDLKPLFSLDDFTLEDILTADDLAADMRRYFFD